MAPLPAGLLGPASPGQHGLHLLYVVPAAVAGAARFQHKGQQLARKRPVQAQLGDVVQRGCFGLEPPGPGQGSDHAAQSQKPRAFVFVRLGQIERWGSRGTMEGTGPAQELPLGVYRRETVVDAQRQGFGPACVGGCSDVVVFGGQPAEGVPVIEHDHRAPGQVGHGPNRVQGDAMEEARQGEIRVVETLGELLGQPAVVREATRGGVERRRLRVECMDQAYEFGLGLYAPDTHRLSLQRRRSRRVGVRISETPYVALAQSANRSWALYLYGHGQQLPGQDLSGKRKPDHDELEGGIVGGAPLWQHDLDHTRGWLAFALFVFPGDARRCRQGMQNSSKIGAQVVSRQREGYVKRARNLYIIRLRPSCRAPHPGPGPHPSRSSTASSGIATSWQR